MAQPHCCGVELKPNAEARKILCKRQELMLQIDEKFFIDSQQPFLKPQGSILIVEMQRAWFLCHVGEVDEVRVIG
jgi:hypothetical protein